MAVRALTFDCYGTLVDWERGLLRDLRAGLAEPLAAADEELLSWYADAESNAESGVFRKYKDILRVALAGVGRRAGADVRDPDALVKGLPEWPVFPDVPHTLRALSLNFRICVVSNVDLDLFLQTQKRLGVAFHEIVTADQIESYKPQLKHFNEAIRRLAVAPDEILHVAQSLYHDHVPAKTLGLRTAWIDRRGGRGGGATPPPASDVKPDLTFSSLADFARHIIPARTRTC
ncbi:MAG: haloacid dehalogenase type II [Planctomycetes bacterium]|nr:haloacid dehalogenase type II [Planctomycetota bacterium]